MALQVDLQNRVAIITGGTKGIGFAIAEQLLQAGGRVLVASRKQESVDRAVAALAKFGESVAGKSCNVSDASDREALIRFAERRYEQLDVLINNAATNPVYGKVEDTSSTAFAKIMAVNVEAPFELAKLSLPLLKRSSHPHVLNISSIGGLNPEPKLGIYSVSKAALNSLTKVLAKEWATYGIQVNAVCPGLIKTEFSQALWSNEKLLSQMERVTPMARMGEPAEVAQLVSAVVGGLMPYTTGHIFTADGGYTI